MIPEAMKRQNEGEFEMKKSLFAIPAIALLLVGLAITPKAAVTGTPVLFTTNEGTPPTSYGPYRVQYITVYVDGVKKGYTESHGNLTATPLLAPGIHEVEYVWANCNNPDKCGVYGRTTSYILIPDQTNTYYVRIPTVLVRFAADRQNINVALNDVWLGVVLSYRSLYKAVLSGSYTVTYRYGYSKPYVPWPDTPPYPGIPDYRLFGFTHLTFGSSDQYTPITDDVGGDPNKDPHIVVNIPKYPWPTDGLTP
jgi:hypothetical protein